jgi:16S rRNA (cytosine967-C5)-methyltransferase
MKTIIREDCDQPRLAAFRVLRQVETAGRFADEALDQMFRARTDLRPLDRAFVHELVMGVLRWQGRLDWIIRQVLKSPGKKPDPRIQTVLRLGVYQIFHLDRVPASAAVNESVRLAKALLGSGRGAGFVNAALRSILRRKEEIPFPSAEEDPRGYLAVCLAHPKWLAARWLKEFGAERAARLCLADNAPPPWTLRANRLITTRDKLSAKLADLGLSSRPAPFSPDGLIAGGNPLTGAPELFRRGFFFLQDEASQLVAYALSPRPGERILDVCAAPGGKSTHIAELMENRGEILALDLRPEKIRLIAANADRLGIPIITPLARDAAEPLPFRPVPSFDRILLDAPCTGLGTLHRHPEAKWSRKPGDPLRLRSRQLALLKNVAPHLKPGGVLVYSTCTLTAEENDGVAAAFLAENPDFTREDLRSVFPASWSGLLDEHGFFRTYPEALIREDGYRMDGFFAARLRKK